MLLHAHGAENPPRDAGDEEGGEPWAKALGWGTSRQIRAPVHNRGLIHTC